MSALTSIETVLHHQFSSAATCVVVPRNGAVSGESRPRSSSGFYNDNKWRGFHVQSRPLDFKASPTSQAEFAVDDYGFEEEKGYGGKGTASMNSGEEGLEIGKLGISEEIVSALSKRGITTLFPIQVIILFFLILLFPFPLLPFIVKILIYSFFHSFFHLNWKLNKMK